MISTKVFVKLVKAAKAFPHAKIYNFSTALDRTYTLTTDYFYVKTKISKENLLAHYYLQLKYLQNLTPNAKS